MQKRRISIKINFSNRWLYTFMIIGILATVTVGVYAFGTNNPSVFGHSSEEIDFSRGITTTNITTNKICLSGVCNTEWPLCRYMPSETQLLASSDIRKQTVSPSPVKMKEIRIGGPGTYTVKFAMQSTAYRATLYARIYINGVAVGTERVLTTGTVPMTYDEFITFSENIPANSNDLIQLYAYGASSGKGLTVLNFRVYGQLPSYDFVVTLN